MIIRTYYVVSQDFRADFNKSYGSMPGSVEDKVTNLFKSSKACEIITRLDIPWSVGIAARGEIVFGMNEEQYLLWKIAGGDHWCVKTNPTFLHEECERLIAQIGLFLNSREGANLRPWKLSFADGMANWSRGDNYQIAIQGNGFVRGLRFPQSSELLDSAVFISYKALLAKFSFFKAIS